VRYGFTLIEMLVALILFEFAMLALAATATVAARNLAAANLGVRAQELARTRVELLRAGNCPGVADGTSQSLGVTEFWSVRAEGAIRMVSDSVEYALPDGRHRRLVVSAWVLCQCRHAVGRCWRCSSR
jgi:Tfp pilus assembly protein PilV